MLEILLVKPEQQLEFTEKMNIIGIPAEVMIDDLQEYVVFHNFSCKL